MFREFKKILRKKPGTVVGIDISDKKIDIAQVEKTDSGIRLVNFMRSPLPQGAVDDGLILDTQAVGKTIKDMLAGSDISYCSAVTSVRGKGTIISMKKYPYMQTDKLRDSIKAEAGNYIAFAGSESLTDGFSFEDTTEEGERKLRVIFGVSKKETIDSYIETMKQTECEIASIGLGALEDLRALYPYYSDNNVIFLIVEGRAVYIFLLNKDIIKSLHSVGFGSEDAEDKEEFISRLSSELDKVITYAREFEGMAPPEKIVLAGELNDLRDANVEKLLEEMNGINVETGNPLTGVDVPPGFNKGELYNMTRGMGLAIRAAGVRTFPADINLLPVEEIEKKELKGQVRQFFIGFFLILILVILGVTSIQLFIKHIDRQTLLASDILNKPTPVTTRLAGIEKGFKEGKEQLKLAGEIIEDARKRRWSEYLNEIKVIIPKKARLTKIVSGQEGLIEITGETVSQEDVFDFVKNLRDSPYFKDIELKTAKDIDKPAGTITGYNITGKLYFYREAE